LVVALGLLGLGAPAPLRHLALQSSLPQADAVVPSPVEIRLDFTEAPLDGTTAIRLLNSAGALVTTGDVTQSADDATVFASALTGPLSAGAYTVAWRAMATDGHVLAEEFAFTVQAAE
jgi:methionine-rich copper-binding protein CopC